MAYWASRGLRGSFFEQIVNSTNNAYETKKLALVQKIPTPITPLEINKARIITKAYFEQKSTVDYLGVVQGIPICFDVKETKNKSLPLSNIHKHQIDFMKSFEEQEGIAFLIVFFTSLDLMYYVPFRVLEDYIKKSKLDGRKSIPYKELDTKYLIKNEDGFLVHYLKCINIDLEEK